MVTDKDGLPEGVLVVEVVNVAVRVRVPVALGEGDCEGVPDFDGVCELENCVSCHSIEEACQSLPARGTTRML